MWEASSACARCWARGDGTGVFRVVSNCCEQISDVLVEQPVPHVPPLSSCLHEMEHPQDPQLLRDTICREAGCRRELFHRPLDTGQREQNLEAARRAEGTHELGDVVGLVCGDRSRARSVVIWAGHD